MVTGIMAAGKSTIAQALAERFPRSQTVDLVVTNLDHAARVD